jgi:hypothetical protein
MCFHDVRLIPALSPGFAKQSPDGESAGKNSIYSHIAGTPILDVIISDTVDYTYSVKSHAIPIPCKSRKNPCPAYSTP